MDLTGRKLITAAYCLVCLLICTPGNSGAAAEKTFVFNDNEESSYIPGTTYNGEFIPARIYYRNPRSAVWQRMSASDNYRDVVTCHTALTALESTGSWRGHLLQDGSCGPQEEPAYFALGNRINYDILLDQDVSSK